METKFKPFKKHRYIFQVMSRRDNLVVEVMGDNIRDAMTSLYQEVDPSDMVTGFKRDEARFQLVREA